jgi:4a-hydroxytetrahydrobiopterin dehydratase
LLESSSAYVARNLVVPRLRTPHMQASIGIGTQEGSMPKMTETEIRNLLVDEPAWTLESGKLVRDWKFKDFVEAMLFVNRIATLAEAAGHHPDIDIRYNQVRLGLVSHDAGGVTQRDAAMAKRITREFPAA